MPAIIDRLTQIFAQLRDGAHFQLPLGRMTGAQFIRLQFLLNWTRRRLFPALAHAAAGRLPRPSRPRPTCPDSACPRPPRAPEAPKPYAAVLAQTNSPLPRQEGWLLPLMPPIVPCRHVASTYGNYLRIALTGADIAPLLSHPSVIRALRPICRMLGISDVLPPKPPRRKPARRISEAPSATAAAPPPPVTSSPPATSPPATSPPATSPPALSPPALSPPDQPPQPADPKPRKLRRIPYHRLRLPMPRAV